MERRIVLPISLCITDEQEINKIMDIRVKLGTKHKVIYMLGIEQLLKTIDKPQE